MQKEFLIQKLEKCNYPCPLDKVTFQDDDTGVLLENNVSFSIKSLSENIVLEKAGPRKSIFFQPKSTKAAIVTCGGLCPGLNDVIRALVMVLWYRYGIKEILGIRFGYKGLLLDSKDIPLQLTPPVVEDIHKIGGTILGSSRGHQSIPAMADFLEQNKISILFTIGGDGTQKGALSLVEEIEKRQLKISIIGIPKTIDNDVPYTEKTFGFDTAVAMSSVPINSAHIEAKGQKNGISIVKLMGRESGFIAAHAALSSGDVNLVLVPEIPFKIENVYAYLHERIKVKHHAVVVVAEGAGREYTPEQGTDESGNTKFGDIGIFLKGMIKEYFKNQNIQVPVKYIDPSYTIHSAPASTHDSVFCFQLARNAVHAAMAGRTAMVVSKLNGEFVHIPMEKAIQYRKKISPEGFLWQSVLDSTGQPPDLS